MDEKKRLEKIRRIARKMNLSIVTGETEQFRPNEDGEWKTDKYGRKYKRAFVPVKGYAIRNNFTGEIITPVLNTRITDAGALKIISDITIDVLDEMVNQLWTASQVTLY